VIVKTKIANHEDEVLAKRGILSAAKVRRIEVDALVDTGATLVSLPKNWADKLGLDLVRTVTARYGNNTKARKRIVGPAHLEIVGRDTYCDILVESPGSAPLIGQVVLEELDLHVDPRKQALIPNPESPDMPLVEVL
jgi:clan AA aspartic protease